MTDSAERERSTGVSEEVQERASTAVMEKRIRGDYEKLLDDTLAGIMETGVSLDDRKVLLAYELIDRLHALSLWPRSVLRSTCLRLRKVFRGSPR